MRKIQINDLRKGMFKAKRSSAPVEMRDSSKEKISKKITTKKEDESINNKSKMNKFGLIEAMPFSLDYNIIERKRLKNYFKRLKVKIIDELFSGEKVIDTNLIYRNEEANRVYKYEFEEENTYFNSNNKEKNEINKEHNHVSKVRDRRVPPESKLFYNKGDISKYKYYGKGENGKFKK